MKQVLLCFLKFPEPGNVKTRLARDLGAMAAAQLYLALAERVITEVYPLDNSYELRLCYDPKHPVQRYQEWIGDSWTFQKQQGSDLGARMSHALEQALGEGYHKAMVIGSDCIGMDEGLIAGAFRDLDRQDFIIGPSTDGGYYLLGLKRTHPWIFEKMEWSTERVLETTLDRIDARGLAVKNLAEKMDIDTLEDLIRFRKSLPEEHFLAKKIDQVVIDRLQLPEGVNEHLLRD